MALAIDVSTGKTGNPTLAGKTLTTSAFTTTSAGEVLVALVSSSDNGNPGNTLTAAISGAGLTWTLALRKNTNGNQTAEVWWATASSVLTSQTVTATMSGSGGTATEYSVALHVLSFTGANTSSPIGASNSQTAVQGTGGTPSITLSTTAGSSCVAASADYWNNHAATAGSGQTLLTLFNDAGQGECEWTQRSTSTTSTSQTMSEGASLGTDGWVFVAAEILAASGVTDPFPLVYPVIGTQGQNAVYRI